MDKRTWAEISLGALAHNYRTLRARTPAGCKFLASVKADGYGHGAVAVARQLEELGADFFSTATVEEALELREAGIGLPILILGWTPPAMAALLAEHDIRQTVFDGAYGAALAEYAARANVRVGIHIKLDTGMSRLGFDPESEADLAAIASLCRSPALGAEGIFTHFAAADTPAGGEYTRGQLARFLACVKKLEEKYMTKFLLRHCANSAGVINWPQAHLDLVRVGIALYGAMPDRDMPKTLGLRPVMTLKTTVAQVRTLPKGAAVGYGCTARLARDTRIAVLTIGYADGFSRVHSNAFEVMLRGKRARSIGRICMDMCMVDVTDIPGVRAGDTAVVFGDDPSVEEYAARAGTISYEIFCSVSKRVPRICVT